MRPLTASDVTFTVRIEQDDIPVRGNALASGDSAVDREVEDEILACLDRGDVEAWCSITVEARWRGYVGRDHLGACSHLPGDGRPSLAKQVEQTIEWHEMRAQALADLNEILRSTADDIASLA
ncbi:MAG TPA: hypothetical protein VGK73_30660 [Polyangiaceae bacterium]